MERKRATSAVLTDFNNGKDSSPASSRAFYLCSTVPLMLYIGVSKCHRWLVSCSCRQLLVHLTGSPTRTEGSCPSKGRSHEKEHRPHAVFEHIFPPTTLMLRAIITASGVTPYVSSHSCYVLFVWRFFSVLWHCLFFDSILGDSDWNFKVGSAKLECVILPQFLGVWMKSTEKNNHRVRDRPRRHWTYLSGIQETCKSLQRKGEVRKGLDL